MAGLARICKTQDTFRTTKAERKRLRDEILGFLGEDHSFCDGCFWSTFILFPSARVTMICAKDSLRGTSEVPCTLVAWLGPNHPPMILKHLDILIVSSSFFSRNTPPRVWPEIIWGFLGWMNYVRFELKHQRLADQQQKKLEARLGALDRAHFSSPLSISIRLVSTFSNELKRSASRKFQALEMQMSKMQQKREHQMLRRGVQISLKFLQHTWMPVLFGRLEKFAEKHRSLPQVCRSFCWKRERAQGHGASPVAWAERRLVSLSLPACYCKYRIV